MRIAFIKLFGNNLPKGTRKKIFVVLFNEELSEDRLIKLAIEENEELSEDRLIKLAAKENEELSEDRPIELAKEEKDEQDKPEELVFWTEGQVLRIFDEPEIIDLIKTSLWEKIKALIK